MWNRSRQRVLRVDRDRAISYLSPCSQVGRGTLEAIVAKQLAVYATIARMVDVLFRVRMGNMLRIWVIAWI